MTLPVRRQEQLLIDGLPELPAGRLLTNTAGRAQFAAAFARANAQATATCWFLDLYQHEQTKAVCVCPPNLHLLCAADPPAEPFEVVAWCFSRQGDGELVREMLQIGHERLSPDGHLIATIDYPRDQWLGELLERLFAKITRRQHETGVAYWATNARPLRKLKSYTAEFVFRDRERLLHLRTRPGVFSHRELDGGARALLKAMEIVPGARVLDLGSGSGAVGIAAALRAPEVSVTAIDSNPRAIEATLWAAERNRATGVIARLDCDGSTIVPQSADLVVANPPYYSDFRIAELFVKTAEKALVKGGQFLVVTKSPVWYLNHLTSRFTHIEARPSGHYSVVSADKP